MVSQPIENPRVRESTPVLLRAASLAVGLLVCVFLLGCADTGSGPTEVHVDGIAGYMALLCLVAAVLLWLWPDQATFPTAFSVRKNAQVS